MSNALQFPAAPNLPVAPNDWDARFQNQFANALRLYFNRLSSDLQQLSGSQGGQRLSFPYGSFSSSATQNIAVVTNAYVVQLDTTVFGNGVSLVDGSKIRVDREGIYNLQFSIQLSSDDNQPQDSDIWLRQNGTDVPGSNSRFGLGAHKNPGNPSHLIAALNVFASMNVGDYLQLAWSATSTNISIADYAAGTGPTRPAIPSVITTLSFISART